MLRILCPIRRSGVLLSTISKSSFSNTIRWKSTNVNVLGNNNVAKESNEFIKWILVIIPVSSFGLGCWQTYRLRWKLNLIAELKSKTSAPPVDLPHDFSELKTMEFRPVKVRGKFLHDKEIFIGPRSLIEPDSNARATLMSDSSKNQGLLVITPFKLSDTGEVILVNRGWIPKHMRPQEKRTPSLITHEVELVGVVRLPQKREPFMLKNQPQKGAWFYRDVHEISEHLGTSEIWLDACGIPDPPHGWPIPNQTRVTLRNEHLSYLVTWFSLSAITGYMWHRYFIKKLPLK